MKERLQTLDPVQLTDVTRKDAIVSPTLNHCCEAERRPNHSGEPDTQECSKSGTNEYRVYPARWFMLGVVCTLNLSTSMNWITFAAAADTSVVFYNISTLQLNLLSMSFMFVTIPVGLPATWVIDTFGLRAALLFSAGANGIGSLLRNISAMDITPSDYKYLIVLIGQILIACAEKFIMMMPTKLAAVWFPENRRAVANMIGGIMDALGNMVAFIIVPLMVNDEKDIPMMLWVMSAPAFLITIVTIFGVCRSRPPTPPSPSAAQASLPFLQGISQLIRNRNYLILNVSFGAGFGLYIAFLTLLEQMLCPRGYSDEFAGLCGALMIVTGTLFAALASIYVDKTKKYDETLKVSYGLACLAGIAFVQVSRERDQHIWVAVTSALFGGFALVIYPVSMELAVEITYPVAVATSSGLCIICGASQGIAYMFAMQYLARPLPDWEKRLDSGCHVGGNFTPQDYTYSCLWIVNCISAAAVTGLVLFFRPKYKRLNAERKIISEQTRQHVSQSNIAIIQSTQL